MSTSASRAAESAEDPPGSPDGAEPVIDWEAAERSPEFQKLVKARRRFVIPATIFFLVWYLAFIVVAGYAPGFMGESVYEGLTVGYVYALTQFVMVGALGLMYLSRSKKTYDPLAAEAARVATEKGARR